MELGLNAHGGDVRFISEPLRFAAGSWWFWIKAGMGFTVGAGVVGFVGAILWITIGVRLVLRLWLGTL